MMKRRVALTIAGMALAPAIAFAQAPGPNTLVIGGGTDASTLDPDDISSRDTANIAQHIWASLFQVTQEGKIVPYLAEILHGIRRRYEVDLQAQCGSHMP